MSESQASKAGKDVIYVDVDDEITSIIDKVENAEQKVVALVLPKRAASLQSIVNMKLLARSAKEAGKNPVLITSEAALLPLAGAAGLHVAKNLQSKPEVPAGPSGIAAPSEEAEALQTEELDESDLPKKIDYGSSIGALAAAHEAENPETIDLDDEDEPVAKAMPAAAPKAKGLKVPNFDRFKMLLGLGVLALVALIVFLILAVTVLPKATITVKTTSEPVSANFDLNASSSNKTADSDKGLIPAKLESSDQTASQQVTATGQQNNGDKATGTITFSIPCSSVSGSPPTIPAGTGVTSGNLGYITQSSASLTNPSFSGGCHFTGSSNITAVAAGAKYNIGSSNFSINSSSSDYSNVSASGSASGGTDNVVTVLSQSDVDGVKQKLTSGEGGSQFGKDFEDKLSSQGEYVLGATLKTSDATITATPNVGQPASTANVTVKVTYSVLTVKKSDLSQIIQDKLAGQIDKKKQKLNGDFLNDATVNVQAQPNPNTANLSVSVETTAVPIIDVASVKKQAEGKKAGDIKAAISSWPGVKEVDVNLSPFWVSKAPSKDSKIKVVLQEVKDNSGDAQP